MSIQVRGLSKYYQVHRKAAGLSSSLRNLFRREYETVKAVDDISDDVLTRPIDNQFLVSLRFIGVYNWGDPLLGLGLVAYACWQLGYAPSFGSLALFGVLCVAGMVLIYSLYLILQTTTFWLVNIERVDSVIWSLVETARFPVSFYRGWVAFFLTAVVPVAFLTTFPAQALIGRLEDWIAVVAVLAAALLFVLARAFWQFALRYYTGASS